MRLSFLFYSLFTLTFVTSIHISPYNIHEKRSAVPSGWSHLRKHHASNVLPLRFALSQSNIDNIGEYLNDVAHPDSPNYSNHWTPGKIASTFAPSLDTIDTVRNWLLASGFSSDQVKLTATKGWIEVNATVNEAEKLLLAQYHVYKHESGKEHVACDSYHLPLHVSPHVDFVTPTVHFDAVLGKRSFEQAAKLVGQPDFGNGPKTTGSIETLLTELKDCDKIITPICLRALYGLEYDPLSPSQNSFGVVEFTPQAFLQSDLDKFFSNFSASQVGTSPVLVSIDGGVVQTNSTGFQFNGESNLDLQYGMALVTEKQPVTLYQVGDLVEGASFNNFLDALDGSYCTFLGGDDPLNDGIYPDTLPGGFTGNETCGGVKPANVISTSYSVDEASLTPFYTARQCAEYAKLGLMGVTILYSSGDHGVAGNNATCLNPNGTQTTEGKIFTPSFPSTCPFVTSVGATQVNPNSTVFEPEGACEQVIFSGGGFSNYFAIPDYQKKAVGNYLEKFNPNYPPNIWNSTGGSRGFPDLSANGANYAVSIDGQFVKVFGTSCSSPVLGALLTMVNDARITWGKKPIGFINPAIYSYQFQDAFHDITTGGNQGCGTPGFTAVPGWDPVTGLGTPNFVKLLEAWLWLP